jgi:hypothetical protein
MIANAVASMQPTGAIAQQLSQAASPRLIAIETMEQRQRCGDIVNCLSELAEMRQNGFSRHPEIYRDD